jgi:(p)ppGpp synthase/HD superfamily hydrolase
MFRLESETEKIVGVLHDVVEDTKYTRDDLRKMGYSETILQALDGVTKREGESYADFVLRAKANPVARKVKLADLEDNMDVRRLSSVTPKDMERLSRYRKAWSVLRNDGQN